MADEAIWRRVDESQKEIAEIRTEVAVIINRTNALEIRTDRMMTDSAESRAEMRQGMGDISRELRHLRDFQKTQEGAKSGNKKAETVQRWAIPAIISAVALAKTMGWI